MIDYHSALVSALKTVGVPVHYEMVLKSGLPTPCISYMETNNYATNYRGDVLEYSRITYQIKIWGNDIAELQRLAVEVDKTLRPLGFQRVSSGELYDNNSTMIQKILSYEALASEKFD